MKKIVTIATALLLTVLFAFSAAAATTHYEFYMTMLIPDGFEEYENEENSLVNTYIDINLGRQINIQSKMNYSDIDYGNLSSSDIYSIEKSSDTVFIPEGSDAYFTQEPSASVAYVNSNKGVKISASYVDPSVSSNEVYATVYIFSTESYIYNIAFMSYGYQIGWYDECLDSLIVGKGSLGTETTAAVDSETTKNVSSSSGSGTGFADFLENVGSVLGVGTIIALIVYVIKRKD